MVPLGSVRKARGWVSLIWVWMGCGQKHEHFGGQGPGGLETCAGEQGEAASQLCPMWQIFWGRWRPGPPDPAAAALDPLPAGLMQVRQWPGRPCLSP